MCSGGEGRVISFVHCLECTVELDVLSIRNTTSRIESHCTRK